MTGVWVSLNGLNRFSYLAIHDLPGGGLRRESPPEDHGTGTRRTCRFELGATSVGRVEVDLAGGSAATSQGASTVR